MVLPYILYITPIYINHSHKQIDYFYNVRHELYVTILLYSDSGYFVSGSFTNPGAPCSNAPFYSQTAHLTILNCLSTIYVDKISNLSSPNII
jgi:hypothetical protein